MNSFINEALDDLLPFLATLIGIAVYGVALCYTYAAHTPFFWLVLVVGPTALVVWIVLRRRRIEPTDPIKAHEPQC